MENSKMEKLSTADLRDLWREFWQLDPPDRMGRTMMIKSIQYKRREQVGAGLRADQKIQLDKLVKQYQRDPKSFDQGRILKAGTKLVRHYSGQKHIVMVLKDGFEYQGQQYTSLSKIAVEITGTAWNGWRFFGIK